MAILATGIDPINRDDENLDFAVSVQHLKFREFVAATYHSQDCPTCRDWQGAGIIAGSTGAILGGFGIIAAGIAVLAWACFFLLFRLRVSQLLDDHSNDHQP